MATNDSVPLPIDPQAVCDAMGQLAAALLPTAGRTRLLPPQIEVVQQKYERLLAIVGLIAIRQFVRRVDVATGPRSLTEFANDLAGHPLGPLDYQETEWVALYECIERVRAALASMEAT